jgi:hypothetical protein
MTTIKHAVLKLQREPAVKKKNPLVIAELRKAIFKFHPIQSIKEPRISRTRSGLVIPQSSAWFPGNGAFTAHQKLDTLYIIYKYKKNTKIYIYIHDRLKNRATAYVHTRGRAHTSFVMATLPAWPTQVRESLEKMMVKQLPTNKVPSHPALGLADCERGKSKKNSTYACWPHGF